MDQTLEQPQMNVAEKARVELPRILLFILAVLCLASFLTETRFLPLQNNVGAFELVSLVLFIVTFAFFYFRNLRLRFHPVIGILGVLLFAALLSQYQVPFLQLYFTVTQVIILLALLIFVFVMYNLLTLDKKYFVFLLRWYAYAAVVVGVWVVADQIVSGGNLDSPGPLRNRAHLGIYMLTAFWALFLYIFLPDTSRRERVFLAIGLAVVLYGIAISGRRSVYVALVVGLGAISFGFLLLHGKARLAALLVPFVALAVFAVFYGIGTRYLPNLDFFETRVGLVQSRLDLAYAAYIDPNADPNPDDPNFIALQREGGLRAFSDHPILGIGWGGFWESDYSPTGHEMHSTPMKFVAELGLVGIVLYVVFSGSLAYLCLRNLFAAKNTPYQISALVLSVALLSCYVSYVYNRQMTDRGFWMLLAIILSFEVLLGDALKPTRAPLQIVPPTVPLNNPSHSHSVE